MKRVIWMVLVILVAACAGETSSTTIRTTTTTLQATTTTVSPTTTTTLNTEEARELIFDLVGLAVGELAISDALTSDEKFVEFQQAADAIVELIETFRTGSFGWGECDDAASAVEDAVTLWQEGVRLTKEGIETTAADLIEAGTTLIELGSDKLNGGRVLRDLCLS